MLHDCILLIYTNRINKVAQWVIRPSQTAFLPDRYIVGVIILHETIHELYRKKLNGEDTSRVKKGLRQGNPLSPILFNLVVDMIAIFIAREKEEALKINFKKSELFCYGEAKGSLDQYSQIFGCDTGSSPFRYLGIPMNHRKLNNKDWKYIEDPFQKKLSNLVSSSKGIALIKNTGCLDGGVLCLPKDQGVLGIINLEIQNARLLSKFALKEQYPSLHNIATKKSISVGKVLRSIPLNIYFRRALTGNRLSMWNELVAKVVLLQLGNRCNFSSNVLDKKLVHSIEENMQANDEASMLCIVDCGDGSLRQIWMVVA
ncbi:hypothetical protein U9M48_011284 [Paspalum notatum var. saurae]|uniref:Reverse transcriptase domain-containing protein n=1 Tax=Paspalum notatum var. saurae TaxID=547442 RepID=A0AAQ3WHB3_PASNO